MRKKGTFEKGFTSNWTEEVVTITTVKATKPPTYTIEDHRGEPVQGSFYEQETANECPGNLPNRTSAQEGKDRVFVKWNAYGSAFNSWVPLDDVEQL